LKNSYRGLGRKFRKSIDAQIRLNELETALANAPDIEECWKRICASSNEFGFSGVRMSVNGAVFEDFATHGGAKLWQLRISLSPSQYVNFFRDHDSETDPVVLSAFADAVEHGLRVSAPLAWNCTALHDHTLANLAAAEPPGTPSLAS
jgi:hypothetical protein